MRRFRYISLLLAALLTTACSTDTTVEEEKVVEDLRPMVFGTSFTATEPPSTRGSSPLQAGFKVGTWKAFGAAAQQTVMDGYRVDYDASAATRKWNYVGVNGQVERYWDLSAYPYEFRAVSPYIGEATISSGGLTVSKPFKAQTLIDDSYSVSAAESEACVVAHVSRRKVTADAGNVFIDTDHIKGEEVNVESKTNATREVRLPFHHLISKIGFRIYIDDPQPVMSDYTVSIQSIKITAKRADGFIIESATYTASDRLGHGTFSGNTTEAGEFTLLQHGLYKDGPDKHWNLHYHLNRANAFDLTPGFLQQIPQGNVKIHVELTMKTHHVDATDGEFTYNSWLSLDRTKVTEAECDLFTWEPETQYIYYLHIPNMHGHDIMLDTCEILPWDDVQSSDINVGI